jgi:hypothetical protein
LQVLLPNDKQRFLAKLLNACHDLEDVLNQSTPKARYDPVIVPLALRTQLSAVRDDLARIIGKLEEI